MTKRVIGKEIEEEPAPSPPSVEELLRTYQEREKRPYESDNGHGVMVDGYYVPKAQADKAAARRRERETAEAARQAEAAQKEIDIEQMRMASRRRFLMEEATVLRSLEELKGRERGLVVAFKASVEEFKGRRSRLAVSARAKRPAGDMSILDEVADLRAALRNAVEVAHRRGVLNKQVAHATSIWKLYALRADNATSSNPDTLLEKKLESAVATGYDTSNTMPLGPTALLRQAGIPFNPECPMKELIGDENVLATINRVRDRLGLPPL